MPNPNAATGLPRGHPDPLRSNPPPTTTPIRKATHEPLVCDADEFIALIQKSHPGFSSAKCIYILMNEQKLGYCKKIESKFHWDKAHLVETIMERSWQEWAFQEPPRIEHGFRHSKVFF